MVEDYRVRVLGLRRVDDFLDLTLAQEMGGRLLPGPQEYFIRDLDAQGGRQVPEFRKQASRVGLRHGIGLHSYQKRALRARAVSCGSAISAFPYPAGVSSG